MAKIIHHPIHGACIEIGCGVYQRLSPEQGTAAPQPVDFSRASAYHEAGHCVAAVALGAVIDLVRIQTAARPGKSGEVVWRPGRCSARSRAVIFAAGGVAEQSFRRDGLPRWSGKDWSDFISAAAGLDRGKLIFEAVALMRGTWGTVDALANRLLASPAGQLSGRTIEEFLAGLLLNKN